MNDSQQPGNDTHELPVVDFPVPMPLDAHGPARVISVCNQKGGVGKTTTAIAMGAVLAELGKKVLLIDVDDSGNPSLSINLGTEEPERSLVDLMLTSYMDRDTTSLLEETILHHEEGMDYIPAENRLGGISEILSASQDEAKKRTVLKRAIAPIRERYEYILLDAAPTLNMMSINLLTAADEIIITTQPQGAAEDGIPALVSSVAQVRQNLNTALCIKGLLITMLDRRTNYNKEKASTMERAYTDLGMRVFSTRIPRAITAESCMEQHQSILKFDPKGKVAAAYRDFVNEYLSEEA